MFKPQWRVTQRRNSHLNGAPRLAKEVDQSTPNSTGPRSLYVAAFALWPQGDEPLELGDYFWFAFPRFYFGLSEAERAPFARYAGAMLERFLRRAERKEDLRHVALLLHRLHFPAPAPSPAPGRRIVDGICYNTNT